MNTALYPNSVTNFLGEFQVHWDTALNILQGAGVVSDECISLADVAEADCGRAICYLQRTSKHLFERTQKTP